MGAKYAKNKDLFYVQTLATVEAILRKENISNFNHSEGKYWLETCGTHTAVNCSLAVGNNVILDANGAPVEVLTKYPGGYSLRTPDALTLCFNDNKNDAILKKIEPSVNQTTAMDNEFSTFYPTILKMFLNVDCENAYFHDFDKIVDLLNAGNAIQICLINPGHFVAVVDYDPVKQELVYIDPAPYRHPDGNWAGARMTRAEYDSNVKPNIVIYKKLP